jgi:NTP pyrophosphatase (non-canonical NTP hydrolase)
MAKYNLKELQKDIDTILDRFPFNWPDYVHYVHLVEEVGELGEALTVYKGDRKNGSGESALADHADLKEEIGDVLVALLRIANKVGVDAEEAIDYTFKRYERKLANLKKNA